jgi:hypothetical protein
VAERVTERPRDT